MHISIADGHRQQGDEEMSGGLRDLWGNKDTNVKPQSKKKNKKGKNI